MRSGRGLTLVELLAALAILASLLVGIVMAHARYQRQQVTAAGKLEAVRHAERLLERWWAGDEPVPHNARGVIEHAGGDWRWRTRPLREGERQLEPWQLRLVRLELFRARSSDADGGGGPGGGGDASEQPAVHVDLLLPLEQDQRGGQEATR